MAARLGAIGGKSRSPAKVSASRINGQLGGRPKKAAAGSCPLAYLSKTNRSTISGRDHLAAPFFLCAEHVRQLEGESPFDNLMEVKS